MDETTFLNIDLDIESIIDIAPIVKSFGENVTVLRNDQIDGVYYGSFETLLAEPNEIIAEYSRIIANLDSKARQIWDQCRVKRFDIGFQGAENQYSYNSTLSNDSLSKISALGGELVITIYAHNAEGDK